MTTHSIESATPSSRLGWLLEALAIGILVFWVYYLITQWSSLPDEVPTNFSFRGKPEAFGSRSDLWVLPSVGILVYGGLTLASRLKRFNYFSIEVTPESSPTLYASMRRLINVTKVVIIAASGYIEWKMVQTARGNAEGLSPWFVPLFTAALLLIVLYPAFRFRR